MIMDRYLFGLDYCKSNKIFKWHKNCLGRLKYFSIHFLMWQNF